MYVCQCVVNFTCIWLIYELKNTSSVIAAERWRTKSDVANARIKFLSVPYGYQHGDMCSFYVFWGSNM